MHHTYLRGQMYLANLDPVIGSEQSGLRPALIIQNDTGNRYSTTIIIAPITSKVDAKPKLPTHVFLPNVLGYPSIVLLEQIRTVSKSRLSGYVGCLDENMMYEVDRCVLISLGIHERMWFD